MSQDSLIAPEQPALFWQEELACQRAETHADKGCAGQQEDFVVVSCVRMECFSLFTCTAQLLSFTRLGDAANQYSVVNFHPGFTSPSPACACLLACARSTWTLVVVLQVLVGVVHDA